MRDNYSITDLAREFGVTTRTIRHYEECGLLQPRRDGVTRVFGGRDRARLKIALRAKRIGFALQEIRELFSLYDAGRDQRAPLAELLSKLDKRRALLEQQREDVQVMLSEIDFFAEQCRKSLGGAGVTD